jgi:hypothetical protein
VAGPAVEAERGRRQSRKAARNAGDQTDA